MKNTKGVLISFTGVDGCGKSTQVHLLRSALEKGGYEVVLSKAYDEPEKESFAHYVNRWDDYSITMLFQAMHRQQFVKASENLAAGKIVIADRWDESFLAYHEENGFLSKDDGLRNKLNQLAFEGKQPDLVFCLDLPVEKARIRMSSRGEDFFDKKSNALHEQKRAKYTAYTKKSPNWHVINADRQIEQIHQDILKKTLEFLKLF